jgi:hypothetical protein
LQKIRFVDEYETAAESVWKFDGSTTKLTQKMPAFTPSGAEHGATGNALRKRDPDLLTIIKTGAF